MATLAGCRLATFARNNRRSVYTRITIPRRLRVYFEGRREVWRSFGTVDKGEATYRSLQFKASGQRLFRNLTQHGRHMTKNQIETLVSRWLAEALDEAEDDRAIGGPVSDSALEEVQDGLSAAFDGAHEALLAGDHRKVAEEADQLLQAAGLPALDHSGADFARLCRRLLRAKIEFLRVESDRWEGEYRDDHFRSQPVGLAAEPVETPASLPFMVVLDKYLLANPRPPRTADPLKAEFDRFLEAIGGDRPIGSITRADCVAYKEGLQGARKLTLVTCIKHLSNLETLFKWSITHDYLPDGLQSPARGLAPSKRQAKKHATQRRPFTDEELLKVFGSKEFRRQRIDRPERYWVVLLLLFECCRREEAGQLYLKDLIETEGIPCIYITDEEKDQTLKNEGSRRKVPLHTSLITLGFMQYVFSIKKAGHVRLFPQLARKGNNGYADPVGKWFGRMVTDFGLTDPRLVIHSLRHGGITKLHSAGVPVNIVETLVGHSAGNVHESYVHKDLLSMKTLRDGLERLEYDEVLKKLS